ncbi:uncharacterized protein CTHT_0060910 [Thermochaetoides thermophila DSM 1495]|uniref:Uncharacterized protein n=1 Tax=Chaetomium thermophilum (strain DSM 1495 / CBS 144.50 / IMI 039719) TaxID=759272 RepID=G0SF60_CHATD|nr:hypothetical protein CTHT_0060910 [Thermochaetoides thermophila DSM 1495]EGS18076.1 hypothetical protein CTHT_0060910 [Thermochaetoides thermophila DSM 1495]
MAPPISRPVYRRYEPCVRTNQGYIDADSCYVPFWSTREGVIIKWSLFLGLIVFISLYLLVGYLHAQQRLKKGLAPLSYHRFLVPRSSRNPNNRYSYPPQTAVLRPLTAEAHYLDLHSIPPPVYDPNAPRPPAYEPSAGSTKVEPNQGQSLQQQQQQQTTPALAIPEGDPPPYVPSPIVPSPLTPLGIIAPLSATNAPGPAGASTQVPAQMVQEEDFVPPPGPPPSHSAQQQQPQTTAGTNPFRN